MGLFGAGVRRICAVVAASTAPEMAKQVRLALRETRTVEVRLDWPRSNQERCRFLVWLKKNRPHGVTLVATCRRREGRGKFAGDVGGELYWLIEARKAGCQWCDLEVETLRKLPDESVRAYAVPGRVLLSVHDFERTPVLPRSFNPPSPGEVDGVKIAAKARTIGDSLRLLRLARRSKNFVAVPMGDVGLPARILALREGSALAYAPVAEATAPGQVSLSELKHLYRAHQLTRRTRVYGVIGDPIGHSLSPLLHNTGFAARHVDAVYLPFLAHQLGDFLTAIPELGIRGFSVTLPHKQTILKYLKECEPLAADIGAVNTIVVHRDGSLYGCNTDYVGVLRALQKKLRLAGSRVLIFGAGGSARAAAFALARAGATVGICARREKAGKELARAVGGEVVPRRALRGESFDAMLNTTPVGMHPRDGISPLAPGELHCRIVMDLIYRPQRTQLLKVAAEKGIATISGVEMFLAQGVAQWEIWMEKRAPEALMRRAVLHALRAEEKSRRRC
ncbi:MAG TPA: shikimate dehydrogenase [Candidatus Acidoferrum sp.]|jgi:3-dehydroquinate dehydratase/shikimate dehydrogenase|nr:shikimate dehydrogenase [Candidatus Acidoferrum sp.]